MGNVGRRFDGSETPNIDQLLSQLPAEGEGAKILAAVKADLVRHMRSSETLRESNVRKMLRHSDDATKFD